MNLIYCQYCGVVLNLDYLSIPDIVEDDGSINTKLAIWTGEHFVPTIECPVCKERIPVDNN